MPYWLHEKADDELTPIAHICTEDYFVFELAMLYDSWQVCMPYRWFTRSEVSEGQFEREFGILCDPRNIT